MGKKSVYFFLIKKNMSGRISFKTALLAHRVKKVDFSDTDVVYYAGRNKGTIAHRLDVGRRKFVYAPMTNCVIERLREMGYYVEISIVGTLNNMAAFRYKVHFCEYIPIFVGEDGQVVTKKRCRINLFCQGKNIQADYDECMEAALCQTFETLIKIQEEYEEQEEESNN
jgi:hypothetical protein